MFSTAVLRQAAGHVERSPMIKFIGRRTVPSAIDHSPQPHPASPTGSLPEGFGSSTQSTKHKSFSSYRDHAQQFGPLRKTIKAGDEAGVGGRSGVDLGPVMPTKGTYFDRSQLPARFRRTPVDISEIEAVESGGAALLG